MFKKLEQRVTELESQLARTEQLQSVESARIHDLREKKLALLRSDTAPEKTAREVLALDQEIDSAVAKLETANSMRATKAEALLEARLELRNAEIRGNRHARDHYLAKKKVAEAALKEAIRKPLAELARVHWLGAAASKLADMLPTGIEPALQMSMPSPQRLLAAAVETMEVEVTPRPSRGEPDLLRSDLLSAAERMAASVDAMREAGSSTKDEPQRAPRQVISQQRAHWFSLMRDTEAELTYLQASKATPERIADAKARLDRARANLDRWNAIQPEP